MSLQTVQVSFLEVQFFTHSSLQHDEHSEYSENQKDTLMESEEFKNQQIFIEPDSLTDSKFPSHSSKTKSVLHNFQKHLFTFIQSLIPKNSNLTNQDKEQICVLQILRLVKGQKKKTRDELVPIFGQFDLMKIKRKYQNYNSLIEQFSEEILRQALRKAKAIMMSRINAKSIRSYVENSKMGRKQEFIGYVQSFIKEVEEGRFGCRLSKESQTSIKQRIKAEIKYNQWQSLIL